MGFPMLATVAWLVWVLGQQTGIDGAGALLALLLLLSMTVWALTLQGRSRSVVAGLSLAALVAATLGIGPAVIDSSQASGLPTPVAGTPASPKQGQEAQQVQLWQPWQHGRVEQLQAAGQTVFVDFTAAWCVTCQYNKKTTLADATVLADLAAKNITLLRADWTRRDPAIAAALSQLGRSGVPVYVFYKAGRPPVVLSELPSVGEIRAAIGKL
jgi:thiol:disulfide interchange protein DsbD